MNTIDQTERVKFPLDYIEEKQLLAAGIVDDIVQLADRNGLDRNSTLHAMICYLMHIANRADLELYSRESLVREDYND